MMAGKHVLITGASGGLGEHFARLLARHGATLSIAARRADRLGALAKQLMEAGAAAVHEVALNVAEDGSIARALSHIESGRAPPLDVLVGRAENIAQARHLLNVPAVQSETGDADGTDGGEPQALSHPCPCCGGRMIIIETFARGCQPKHRPALTTAAIRIDTS
jgi:NAD(P)-dependent dehydrogenase (short-subunit alcohol dehydrogenase family)